MIRDKTDDWDARNPGPPKMSDEARKVAEAMREMAARLCVDWSYSPDVESGFLSARTALIRLAAAIRALKVEG